MSNETPREPVAGAATGSALRPARFEIIVDCDGRSALDQRKDGRFVFWDTHVTALSEAMKESRENERLKFSVMQERDELAERVSVLERECVRLQKVATAWHDKWRDCRISGEPNDKMRDARPETETTNKTENPNNG